jgi:hypothetical protein
VLAGFVLEGLDGDVLVVVVGEHSAVYESVQDRFCCGGVVGCVPSAVVRPLEFPFDGVRSCVPCFEVRADVFADGAEVAGQFRFFVVVVPVVGVK